MIATSSLAAALPPAAIDPIVRSGPVRPRNPGTDQPLGPAVILDLSPDASRDVARGSAPATDIPEPSSDRAHYQRDADTNQIVFQILGPDGTVVEQMPSEAALRARTYAREAEAARATEIGTAVARSA
ncbi:hypothetical protein [Methylobacterium tarhaniae]|uniref:hypothetical protein n=1 Tax=Methylobacterium tarhaniae TaxID=1187852 RepID=UPI000A648537|nr:hypothetical protein [Methylobacterium tarhaniae]